MSAYGATVRIHGFSGLYQDGDGVGVDPKYALEAVNVETAGGVLQSAARCEHLKAEVAGPIGTLMRLHRRWHTADGQKDVLVAASGGQLYFMPPDGDVWTRLQTPEGIEAYESDAWSFAAYEINPEGTDAPVDVLLLSNERDGMICVRGDTMAVSHVPTPKKFGVIARYAERIWGGAIADNPDMLSYSAPFDPFDWTQNNDLPEDGAGDILQPSWDGDSFLSLTQFGAQLLALKKRRVWRILGTDPGEYVFREQYGGGVAAPATVAVAGERVLMLGEEGLESYDGLSVEPYGRPYAKGVFARMNRGAVHGACACLHGGRYYLALPLNDSPHNNAVLVYDTRERSWLLREGITVRAFLSTDQGLYFTSATEPGRVWKWGEDARRTGAVSPARWIGPWLELGEKNARKGGWTVLLTVEAEAPAELWISIRTEKKVRTKRLDVAPSGRRGELPRQRKLVFGGSGRRFRLEIESRGLAAWRLVGGIQVDVEADVG